MKPKKLSVNDEVQVKLNDSHFLKGTIAKFDYEFCRMYVSVRYDGAKKPIKVPIEQITKV